MDDHTSTASPSLWERHVVPFLVEKACRSTEILAERKRVIPRARGEVLEIGVGSGLNLAFYDAGRVTRVSGIDPSEALLTRARARLGSAKVEATLTRAAAESLPFADASFDTIVTTYTMCSVEDATRALNEARRVLRTDGTLLFVEHGLAPDADAARWQRRLTPAWRRVGGGCRLDRDMRRHFADAGLEITALDAHYGDGPRWLSFTYEGEARASH